MNDGQRRPSAPPKPIGMGIGGGSSQFEHTLLNYRGTGRMKSCKCIQPFRWNKRTVRCNDHRHSFACCIICFWACWFHLQGNGKCPGPFRKSLYEQRLGLLAPLIFRCSSLTNFGGCPVRDIHIQSTSRSWTEFGKRQCIWPTEGRPSFRLTIKMKDERVSLCPSYCCLIPDSSAVNPSDKRRLSCR